MAKDVDILEYPWEYLSCFDKIAYALIISDLFE